MYIFTEIADQWDAQKNTSEVILDDWVESNNYNQGAILAAVTLKTAMQVGYGLVDVLRLGDGVKQGGIGGYTSDVLRLVAFVPVGKVTSLFGKIKSINAARLIRDPAAKEGICFWVTGTRALRQLQITRNGKYFMEIKDLAKALGKRAKSIQELGTVSLAEAHLYFKQLGVRTGSIIQVNSEAAIRTLIPKNGNNIVMINVGIVTRSGVKSGHSIYAYRNPFTGQVRFMDRTNPTFKNHYTSLTELRDYTGLVHIEPVAAFVAYGAQIKRTGNLLELALPIRAIAVQERE